MQVALSMGTAVEDMAVTPQPADLCWRCAGLLSAGRHQAGLEAFRRALQAAATGRPAAELKLVPNRQQGPYPADRRLHRPIHPAGCVRAWEDGWSQNRLHWL